MTSSCEGFVDSDVDGRKLGAFHTGEIEQVCCVVDNGDVHRDADFFGALFGSGQRNAGTLEGERRDVFR